MKKKTKENILCAIAVALFCATLVVTIFLSAYLMRAGVAIESEMPSMQENFAIDK